MRRLYINDFNYMFENNYEMIDRIQSIIDVLVETAKKQEELSSEIERLKEQIGEEK